MGFLLGLICVGFILRRVCVGFILGKFCVGFILGRFCVGLILGRVCVGFILGLLCGINIREAWHPSEKIISVCVAILLGIAGHAAMHEHVNMHTRRRDGCRAA